MAASRFTVVLFVAVLGLAAVAVPGAGATGYLNPSAQQSDFTISTPNSVEIPERAVTIDGTDYQVAAVGRVAQGDTLRVDVEDPNDRSYDVYLYSRNNEIEQTDAMEGSGTATFSTDSLEPGTYLAGVYYDGKLRVVEPVIVEGYTVSIDPPSSVDRGETATVELSVTETAGGSVDRIQVVLGDSSTAVRVNATESESGGYVATIPTEEFSPGTYNIYGVVRGTKETDGGRDIILGLSDGQSVKITDPTPTPTPTPTSDSNDDDGGTVGDSDDDSGTVSPTATQTPTPTSTATAGSPTATGTPTQSASATTTATQTPPATDSPSPSDADVTTPASPSQSEPTSPTGTSQSGFGLTAVLASLLAIVALERRD